MPMTPYTGTFGKPELLHLVRRTLFGAKKSDLAYFANRTLSSVVTELLTVPLTAPSPPVNTYNTATIIDDFIAPGAIWVNGPSDSATQNARERSMRSWWMGQILNQDRNILEKMVLFLHNLVPTDIGATFAEPIYAYRYNALVRQYALGNYKDFIRKVTIEPAMLYYLDGRYNTKAAANENYGRELQELFTVGKDSIPYYTEGDVQMAAQVLTGWSIDTRNLVATFTANNHVTTDKVFSGFYGGTVISTPTSIPMGSNAGLIELDALLNMIFAKTEVSKYIMRKLYRFFVYYNIDASVERDVIEPLATTFRNSGYQLAPVLQELFTSQHFFDNAKARACMIKNPVDYVVGMAHQFGLTYAAAPDLTNQYRNWLHFHDSSNSQQMKVGNPPGVEGWGAYHQSPSYHELWINAETLRRKKEFSDKLITGAFLGMSFDILGFTAALDNPSDPNALIAEVIELMHVVSDDATIVSQLKSILLSNQTSDYYWTIAWDAYIAAPTNTTNLNTVRTRLRTFYQAVTGMAEHHLS